MKTLLYPLNKTQILVLLLCGLFSFSGYLLIAYASNGHWGFPLDDGWIHQTYARNLAERGEWSYLPGRISGGSTSPGWTLVLAFMYWINAAPFVGTYLAGFAFSLGSACLAELIFRRCVGRPVWGDVPVCGIFLLFEWHLVWAGLSGMETPLFIMIILLVFLLLSQPTISFFALGTAIGFCVWVRPDGLTLIGPVLFTLALSNKPWKDSLVAFSRFAAGFLLLFVPYLVFTRIVAGTWMPSTFYAKQTEYAILREVPLLSRMAQLYLQPLVGGGLFLLPGFLFQGYVYLKKQRWQNLSFCLWSTGYIFIFVLLLPVTYQHGRYLMPAMPVFFIIGLIGLHALWKMAAPAKRLIRMGAITLLLSGIAVTAAFWWRGAVAYQEGVAIIHEEMVVPALWIRDNTAPGSIIAAHDIGGLGFFGEREIIDLAGLITPEIIPFIRDEPRLLEFIRLNNADYLMTFPDWYEQLPSAGEIVYVSGGPTVLEKGRANMTVYRLMSE